MARRGARGAADRPTGAPRPRVQDSDIELVMAVDGCAPPRAVAAAAQRFGMSKASARAWINRLRRRGLLRTAALVDRARCGPLVESVAYVRVNWSHPEVGRLETTLREDPAVIQAALTFGPFDYTAFAIHADGYGAANWSRWLDAQPYVSWCRVERVQTRFNRFAAAATLLPPAPRPRDPPFDRGDRRCDARAAPPAPDLRESEEP